MRILIVDDELVSRNKMNVLLKPFGECTTIGNGVLAIRLFKDALEKNQPFQLVTLDVEMPGMLGTEVLARFRDMEAPYMQYNPEMMAKVLMVTSHSDYETVSTAIARCNGYIVKPFNNESIHAALKKLGLMDEEGTEIAAAVPREPSVLSPLERFSKLLESGMDLEEQEFQSLMNQMAEEIGQEAEKKLIQQLDAATKGSPLLIRILGAMGSQPRQAYLEPLKRLIERSPHYQLRKEAILVLAKKGDDSVLQALTYLQEKVNNSSLQTIIVSEISAIKQNKPYLGIMPLFLEGQKDPKTHKNIVNTLKKIIKPEDVVAFTAYLDKDDPVVRLGAFELLC
ncbi:MAG: response regulator, partial [Syntrophales bacterium LBB04]|nr:response regulator [Syntrophales bacterium LBB04]